MNVSPHHQRPTNYPWPGPPSAAGVVLAIGLVVLIGFMLLRGSPGDESEDPRAARPLPAHANGDACRDVGLDAVLAGHPSDPQLAWLIGADDRRMDVLWPSGYSARFTPELEVLDEDGNVVLGEGDPVTGACVAGDESLYLTEPFDE